MNRLQIKIIKDAIEDPEPLTDWEHDRIQEWAAKDKEYVFSEKQNAIINRIGQKYL